MAEARGGYKDRMNERAEILKYNYYPSKPVTLFFPESFSIMP